MCLIFTINIIYIKGYNYNANIISTRYTQISLIKNVSFVMEVIILLDRYKQLGSKFEVHIVLYVVLKKLIYIRVFTHYIVHII